MALYRNLLGGERPDLINADLLLHQARYFVSVGKMDIANAVALEALDIASNIKTDDAYAKKRKKLGYEFVDEGQKIRDNIKGFISTLGAEQGKRLKNAWALFRRPFFIQLIPIAIASIFLLFNLFAEPEARSTQEQVGSIKANTDSSWRNSAPNGIPWPTATGYLDGYYQINADGNSVVVVDNSRSDTPVFVKLYEVGGKTDWTVRYAYISANDSFRMEDLSPGRYELRYRDLKSGAITKSEDFTLKETVGDGGVRYTEMTVTLYKVSHGNMRTTRIDESQF